MLDVLKRVQGIEQHYKSLATHEMLVDRVQHLTFQRGAADDDEHVQVRRQKFGEERNSRNVRRGLQRVDE